MSPPQNVCPAPASLWPLRRNAVRALALALCAALGATLSCTIAACKSDSSANTSESTDAPQSSSTASSSPPVSASAPQPSDADAASSTPPNDSRPIIVCFGDSLTAGYGTDPGQSYPDDLQRDLDQLGYQYRVVNAGVSGDTTKDGTGRLKDVVRLKPVLVIVAFGGNDGLRGLPISTSRGNLDTIVATLRKAGSKVVLGGITLPPNYGADYIRQFDQSYQLIAKKYHAPLMPFILQGVYGVPGSMQNDGIHATAQGNKQVALNLLPLVKPFLRKP